MLGVNLLTAVLTLLTLVGYSVIYTVFLKPRTPQNIVIGGAAGAAPPVLGLAAVTGEVTLDAMLLFLIVFVWTPPHFWALALYRERTTRTPHSHAAGDPWQPLYAALHADLALALAVVCVLPFASGMSGTVYLIGALALNARFVAYAWQLTGIQRRLGAQVFRFSISFLAAWFALLLFDRYVLPDLGSLRPLLDALVL